MASPSPPPSLVATPSIVTEYPDPSPEPPPDQVKGTYSHDLNILKIHEAIVARYASLRGELPQLQQQLEALQMKVGSPNQTRIGLAAQKQRQAQLEEQIRAATTGSRWNEYIRAAEPLLQSYLPLISNQAKGVITIGKSEVESTDAEIVTARLHLIQDYLAVARQHISIDLIRATIPTATCPNCGVAQSRESVEDDNEPCICSCGFETIALAQSSRFKDNTRVSSSNHCDYDDRETFRKGLLRFEGRSSDKIPSELYDQLDAYYQRKGFPTGAQVRAHNNDPTRTKISTSVPLLINGLAGTNNASFYNVMNLIGHQYWNWQLPDLADVRDRILEEYDATQKVYSRIKTRDSSLNVNIRIYLHLCSVGYPCSLDQFKTVSSRDSLLYHQAMWKQMCEEAEIAPRVKFTAIA